MREVKIAAAIAAGVIATCAMVMLVLYAAVRLTAWWLFTGVFLETEAEMGGFPRPPIPFLSTKARGIILGI